MTQSLNEKHYITFIKFSWHCNHEWLRSLFTSQLLLFLLEREKKKKKTNTIDFKGFHSEDNAWSLVADITSGKIPYAHLSLAKNYYELKRVDFSQTNMETRSLEVFILSKYICIFFYIYIYIYIISMASTILETEEGSIHFFYYSHKYLQIVDLAIALQYMNLAALALFLYTKPN